MNSQGVLTPPPSPVHPLPFIEPMNLERAYVRENATAFRPLTNNPMPSRWGGGGVERVLLTTEGLNVQVQVRRDFSPLAGVRTGRPPAVRLPPTRLSTQPRERIERQTKLGFGPRCARDCRTGTALPLEILEWTEC